MNTHSERLTLSIIFGALIGAAIMIMPGLIVSQHCPIFGGLFESIATPWSPLRLRLIGVHLITFAVLGAIVGAPLGFWRAQSGVR